MKTLMYFKRVLLGAVVAAIPVVIAACYGPYYSLSGHVTDSKTDDEIPNIEVTCIVRDNPDSTYDEGEEITVFTNENGYYSLSTSNGYACDIVKARDVDGSENGRYLRKTIYTNYAQDFIGDIELRRLD